MNSFGVCPQTRPSGHCYECSRRRDEMHLITSTADTNPGVWSPSLRAEPLVSGACTSYRTDIQESHKTWQEQTSSPTQSVGKKTKTCPPGFPFPGSTHVPNSQLLPPSLTHTQEWGWGMQGCGQTTPLCVCPSSLLLKLLHCEPFHELQSFRINIPQGLQGISALEPAASHPLSPASLTLMLRSCFPLLLFPLFSQHTLCFWPFPWSFPT